MTGEDLLRALIREEIGRNLKRGDRVDFYPWAVEDNNVSIVFDTEKDMFWAYVEDKETGKTQKKLLPNEDEARHWARQMIDQKRQKGFAQDDA